MLFANQTSGGLPQFNGLRASMPTALPTQLMGPSGITKIASMMFSGPDEIKGLQTALKNLSVATQRPDIDPGSIDGAVGTKTVQAVIAAQTLISSELPSTVFLLLQVALAVGATTAKAREAIASAAVPLTVAANTAAVKFAKPAIVETPGFFPTTGLFGPGWYKTPFGIALILGGLFVAYKLFLSKPTAAKAAT